MLKANMGRKNNILRVLNRGLSGGTFPAFDPSQLNRPVIVGNPRVQYYDKGIDAYRTVEIAPGEFSGRVTYFNTKTRRFNTAKTIPVREPYIPRGVRPEEVRELEEGIRRVRAERRAERRAKKKKVIKFTPIGVVPPPPPDPREEVYFQILNQANDMLIARFATDPEPGKVRENFIDIPVSTQANLLYILKGMARVKGNNQDNMDPRVRKTDFMTDMMIGGENYGRRLTIDYLGGMLITVGEDLNSIRGWLNVADMRFADVNTDSDPYTKEVIQRREEGTYKFISGSIRLVRPMYKNRRMRGAFYPYVIEGLEGKDIKGTEQKLNTVITSSEIQLFKGCQVFEKGNFPTFEVRHCLENAIRGYIARYNLNYEGNAPGAYPGRIPEIPEGDFMPAHFVDREGKVPANKLRYVAAHYGVRIVRHYFNDETLDPKSKRINTVSYPSKMPNPPLPEVHICIYREHFMPYFEWNIISLGSFIEYDGTLNTTLHKTNILRALDNLNYNYPEVFRRMTNEELETLGMFGREEIRANIEPPTTVRGAVHYGPSYRTRMSLRKLFVSNIKKKFGSVKEFNRYVCWSYRSDAEIYGYDICNEEEVKEYFSENKTGLPYTEPTEDELIFYLGRLANHYTRALTISPLVCYAVESNEYLYEEIPIDTDNELVAPEGDPVEAARKLFSLIQGCDQGYFKEGMTTRQMLDIVLFKAFKTDGRMLNIAFLDTETITMNDDYDGELESLNKELEELRTRLALLVDGSFMLPADNVGEDVLEMLKNCVNDVAISDEEVKIKTKRVKEIRARIKHLNYLRRHNAYQASITYFIMVNGEVKANTFVASGLDAVKDVLSHYYNLVPRKKKAKKPNSPAQKKWAKSESNPYHDGKYHSPTGVDIFCHGMNYDFSLIRDHLEDMTLMGTTMNVKGVSGRFYDMEIMLKCTTSFLPGKLADMATTFKFPDVGKGVIPYCMYTLENIRRDRLGVNPFTIREFKEYLRRGKSESAGDSDCESFDTDYFKNFGVIPTDDMTISIIKLSEVYCVQDTELLALSFLRFRQMSIMMGVDVIDCMTASKYAEEYLTHYSALEGIPKISGDTRRFLQSTYTGGRTLSYRQMRIRLKNGKYKVIDGRSLYPSAIYRAMLEYGGFPTGAPRVLKADELNWDNLKNEDFYYVQVKVKRYGKKNNSPVLSTNLEVATNCKGEVMYNKDGSPKMKKGSIKYYYDIPEGGIVVNLCFITLEDLVKYHDMKSSDFEILGGVIFEGEVNPEAAKCMQYIYTLRTMFKEERDAEGNLCKNPIQSVMKLVLNSSYGKFIQKAYETETKSISFADEAGFNYELGDKLERLRGYHKYDENKAFVELEKHGIHANRAHLGSIVLAMSKRIMFEVCHCVEIAGGKVYYQDTDSVYIALNLIPEIEKHWKVLYAGVYVKKDADGNDIGELPGLLGDSLGQFHNDLEFKDDIGDTAHITDLIVIGAKMKCAKVRYETKKGWKDTICFTSKGVTHACITQRAKDEGCTVFDLFERMYNGECIAFDLCNKGGGVTFNYDKSHNVFTRKVYIREVKATYDECYEEDGVSEVIQVETPPPFPKYPKRVREGYTTFDGRYPFRTGEGSQWHQRVFSGTDLDEVDNTTTGGVGVEVIPRPRLPIPRPQMPTFNTITKTEPAGPDAGLAPEISDPVERPRIQPKKPKPVYEGPLTHFELPACIVPPTPNKIPVNHNNLIVTQDKLPNMGALAMQKINDGYSQEVVLDWLKQLDVERMKFQNQPRMISTPTKIDIQPLPKNAWIPPPPAVTPEYAGFMSDLIIISEV